MLSPRRRFKGSPSGSKLSIAPGPSIGRCASGSRAPPRSSRVLTAGLVGELSEPLLDALRVPYRVINQKGTLKREIQDAHFSCRSYGTPIVLLLTGEVLW